MRMPCMPRIEFWGGPLDGTVLDYPHAPEQPFVTKEYTTPNTMLDESSDACEVVQTRTVTYVSIGKNPRTGSYLYTQRKF